MSTYYLVEVRHANGDLAFTVAIYPCGKGTSPGNAIKAARALATTPGCTAYINPFNVDFAQN